MSYNCQKCGKTYFGTQLTKVTEVRNVKYIPYTERKIKTREGIEIVKSYGEPTYGWEVVKDVRLCDDCDSEIESQPWKEVGNKEVEYLWKRKRVFNKEAPQSDYEPQKYDQE